MSNCSKSNIYVNFGSTVCTTRCLYLCIVYKQTDRETKKYSQFIKHSVFFFERTNLSHSSSFSLLFKSLHTHRYTIQHVRYTRMHIWVFSKYIWARLFSSLFLRTIFADNAKKECAHVCLVFIGFFLLAHLSIIPSDIIP